MKKVLIGILGVLALLVAAVLIVPSFIDWNQYKTEITAGAESATGRQLIIDGDIGLSVLPAPALVVEDLRLAAPPGATDADTVRLKSLEVRIALGPLLGGRIQVEQIRLVEPLVNVEILADGRTTLDVAPPAETAPDAAPTPAEPGTPAEAPAAGETADAGPPLDIRLDSFVIENGTVVIRDTAKGTVERIENLDAEIAANSLNGPFESRGGLTARGIPVRFDVAAGQIGEGRAIPFKASIAVDPGNGQISVSGTVAGFPDAPRLTGRVEGGGNDLSALAGATAGTGLPAVLARSFAVEANLAVNPRAPPSTTWR